MKSRLSELSFNIIMRMTAGKRYSGAEVEDLKKAKHFGDIIREIFEVSGASSPGDFLPFLQWFDFQGIEIRMLRLKKSSDEFSQGLIEEHRNKKRDSCPEGEGRTKTMIDNMLSLQESEPQTYTDEIIKGLVLTMLSAGTETSAVTMEWAMSLLLNNPEVQKKARAEPDNHVGQDRLVDESDFPKLPCLQSVISETFRLYPAAPLLVPHQSSDDCKIGDLDIPRGTMLLINAWAVHRDPQVWDDPTRFWPERFERSDVEPYKLITFGVGRRACPGAGLASRVVGLALASLIQCFEWERTGEEDVDLSEGPGITMPKAKPLKARCKARKSMIGVLAKL